ncbi:hypothetical protein cypCar_00029770 [Cyprinus carpio]|nr:hypothetical protein cypCar_00029770 [Cyprinus carpio]
MCHYKALMNNVRMQAEADRRQNLVDDLATREARLKASFNGEISEAEPARSSLMTGGHGSGPGVNPWLVNESEETRGLGFGEIKHQQQQIIEAQDAGLDALAAVISRQKQMGQEIGNELDEQNANLRSAWFYFVTPLSRYTTYDVIGSKMSLGWG